MLSIIKIVINSTKDYNSFKWGLKNDQDFQ